MISTPHEYIALLERRGRFSPWAPIPDHNTKVWAAYFELYQRHIGGLEDVPIYVTPDCLGLYRDPLAEDPLGDHVFAWAMVGAICHPILPFSLEEIVAGMGGVFDTFARCGVSRPAVVTETFELSPQPAPEHERRLLWINTPLARIHDDFRAYAASLSSSRRHELRCMSERFSPEAGFTFELSDRSPDTGEVDFMLTNLHRRWGGRDVAYALLQSLWAMAVAAVMPERVRFMRVRHRGALAFLNSFTVRDHVIIAQATCKNEDMRFNGLGIFIDFKTIEALSGQGSIRHLDPTCRTAVVEPENIGIAKRKVVNENARKPVLLAGYDLPALEVAYPCFVPGQGWLVPDAPAAMGKTV